MLIASSGRPLRTVGLIAFAMLLTSPARAQSVVPERPAPPVVQIKTNVGTIDVELWPDKAPRTVNNFLRYVRSGFYDGTIFHRVIKGSVIQGGGLTEDLSAKPTRKPIKLETNGRHEKLTIGMARGEQPNTATSQFFINLDRNSSYDDAYAVFGRVVKGNAIVDQIARAPVRRHSNVLSHLPVNAIVIEKVSILPPGEQPQ
ncbi:MAG: peptidylprolyl isomerase [Acidobacteriota bacterium]|nr:peptidylprolyl isomerase [Acidobacteriota bacterium]